MKSLFGERATAELVGKLRLLTACELCKKPCNETYFAVECNHYVCRNCVRQAKNGCAKCSVPGTILRAHYLDPISETLLKLKDLLSGETLPKPTASKRKAEPDMMTPTSKAIRSSLAASGENPKSPTIDMIFARKSKPSCTETQDSWCSTPSTQPIEATNNVTPIGPVKSAEEVLLGHVKLTRSIRDSPVIRTELDKTSLCCSCGKQGTELLRGTSDTGVQVSNSILTLDVAVHAKPSTTDTGMQTDEYMSDSPRPILSSIGMQTERLYIPVKRYFEATVQTEEQADRLCIELGPDAKSLTSTQAGGENQTAHAQPISLDMSPIQRLNRADAPTRITLTSPKKTCEDAIDWNAEETNKDSALSSIAEKPGCSKMRDTLDSLDYKTMDLKEARDKSQEKSVGFKQRSPEPDSLDSLPSELFNDAGKAQKTPLAEKHRSPPQEKDTLESFFKSSQEVSIPETEPVSKSKTPVKVAKSKRAVVRPEPDSPLRLVDKKKTVIVSDEDEPISKARYEASEHQNRPSKSKTATKTKENRMPKKSQSKITKALPTFSSDEDDVDPLPMDTEDMRNLEKEIENLDREMEDSRNCGKSRF